MKDAAVKTYFDRTFNKNKATLEKREESLLIWAAYLPKGQGWSLPGWSLFICMSHSVSSLSGQSG